MVLALIGIIYGALVAMVQPNMKKLIAYSSISHLGFVVLGIFSFTQAGLDGAMFIMLAHGISTGGLFMLAGILYERRHTYEISEFGGLATPMPHVRDIFPVHRSGVGRIAAAEWLRRRVPGAERRVSGAMRLRHSGRDRRDLERVLSAVDVSAGILRQGEARREQTLPDLELRERDCAMARRRLWRWPWAWRRCSG